MAGELNFDAVWDGARRWSRPGARGVGVLGVGFDAPVFIVPHSDITMLALVAKPGIDQVVLSFSYSDSNTNPLWQIAAVEVWISKVNDRTQASEFGEGSSPYTSFTHMTPAHEGTSFYWIRARDGAGNVGAWFPSSATEGVQATPERTPNVANVNPNLGNGKLVATVAANALTVGVKTLSGNDPGVDDPVFVAFRNSDGTHTSVAINSARSVGVDSGSTLQTEANIPFRVWVVAYLASDGTARIAVINVSAPLFLFQLSETGICTVNVPAAGNADLANIVYGAVAATAVPYRIIGYLEWSSGLATPGTWSSAPDIIGLAGRGLPFPGDVVKEYSSNLNVSVVTGTGVIPNDDTIPQISEGFEYMGFNWVGDSEANWLDVTFVIPLSDTLASDVVAALFEAGESDATAISWCNISANNGVTQLSFHSRTKIKSFNVVDAIRTYSLRLGDFAGGTITVNGINSARKFGGVLRPYIRFAEIMG